MGPRPFTRSAAVYDLIYQAAGKDYRREAEELHAAIQARNPGARTLLDVACGTGAHLAEARRWYQVAGVDREPAMLAQARTRLGDAALVCADMRSFALRARFDAVVCLFSSIGYMRTGAELDEAVTTLRRHLAPGGVVVIDGWVRPEAWRHPGMVDALAAQDGGLVATRVVRTFADGRHSSLEMHHLVGTLEGVDHIVERHDLTLFTDDEYRHAFRAAGLEVEVVPSPMPDRDRYIGTLTGDRAGSAPTDATGP